jgi:hypothetical protein
VALDVPGPCDQLPVYLAGHGLGVYRSWWDAESPISLRHQIRADPSFRISNRAWGRAAVARIDRTPVRGLATVGALPRLATTELAKLDRERDDLRLCIRLVLGSGRERP